MKQGWATFAEQSTLFFFFFFCVTSCSEKWWKGKIWRYNGVIYSTFPHPRKNGVCEAKCKYTFHTEGPLWALSCIETLCVWSAFFCLFSGIIHIRYISLNVFIKRTINTHIRVYVNNVQHPGQSWSLHFLFWVDVRGLLSLLQPYRRYGWVFRWL